jgi:endoglucanase
MEGEKMSFQVHKGTNISHWLSQSNQRGVARAEWFTKKDVQYIANLRYSAGSRGAGGSFDHLRIPIDEVQMWDEEGRRETEAFDLLDAALDWCAEAGLRAIVDLHILRSHYFNDQEEPRLFTDSAEEARFAGLWRDLSSHLESRSNDWVAYELLNEAVARDPEDWNRVAMAAFSAVREREPERTIVLGSNWFNQHHTFERLAVPDDPNLILTYHYYFPMLITHHQARWWYGGGVYAGPIHYPGTPIAPQDLEGLDQAFLERVDEWNTPFDRSQMVADLAQPLAVRARTGLPLYCGEFGCYEKTPQAIRLAWYRDMMQTFEEFDIAWANWDYKGSFGIVTHEGQDTGIAEVLLA